MFRASQCCSVSRLSVFSLSIFPLQLRIWMKMSRVGRDSLTGFVSINVTPVMCCYSPCLSPSLFVLMLCRRLCSSFPLSHTHTQARARTHSLLVVLECVLVGQRLHNTELWVPSHVFVHHAYRCTSLQSWWNDRRGDGGGQRSSCAVYSNDTRSVYRSQIRQLRCMASVLLL